MEASLKHKHAMAARSAKWIVYSSGEDLDSWLDINKPSKLKRDDHVGWIAIYSMDSHASRAGTDKAGDLSLLMAKWEAMKISASEPGSCVKINVDSIRTLARDWGFITGKWICHVRTGIEVDDAWAKVCKAMIGNGVLAQVATCAKVSPFDGSVANYLHVISTHGRDYSNFDEVCRLERALRVAGIMDDLKYKPDVYSHLGIYADNNWNIRPTIYSSRYDNLTKQSKVVSLDEMQPASGALFSSLSSNMYLNMAAYRNPKPPATPMSTARPMSTATPMWMARPKPTATPISTARPKLTATPKRTASELKMHAVAARMDEWIVYSPGEDLGSWLDSNKPSKLNRDNHVGWIAIYNNMDDHASRDGDMELLTAKWETMKKSAAEPGSSVKINFDSIRTLARDCGFVAGKWICHLKPGNEVDYAWAKVCKEMIGNGVLADVATSSKVSPFDQSVTNYMHVISTHGRDYSNFEEVCKLERALRAAGITADLKYKPDVYSHLGIYANNEWGIRPTIYSSRYDTLRKQSSVIPLYDAAMQPSRGSKHYKPKFTNRGRW